MSYSVTAVIEIIQPPMQIRCIGKTTKGCFTKY